MSAPSKRRVAAAANPPQPIEVEGEIGPVARLADGRIASIYGVGRPVDKWDDAAIPQQVVGRFSSDAGKRWTPPQLLFPLPPEPGLLDPYAAPLATSDGALHYFSLIKHHISQPINWRKAYTDLIHAVSPDGGRSWEPPRKIEWGRRWAGTLNSVIQLASGRIILPFCYLTPGRSTGLFAASALLSDDRGETWRESANQVEVDSGGKVVESGAIEPAVVELADGRIWMVIRTQTGYLFESYSSDAGETWSPANRTTFRASNCPLNVLRLSSGALLLIWNNEFGEHLFHGVSYSRQSLVMAINDGDGWKGYRQINPPFGPEDDIRAVANYPYMVETDDGGVLVSYRERRRVGEASRFRLMRVDPRWLLEREASEDFTEGIANLQLNGAAAPQVAPGADGKPPLRLVKPGPDEPAGFTWNFPFGRKGSLELRLHIPPGSGGAYFALSEYLLRPNNREGGTFRWMAGPDLTWRIQYTNNGPYAEVSPLDSPWVVGGTAKAVPDLHLTVEWDCDLNSAKLFQNRHYVATLVGLEAAQGLAYVRLFLAAPGEDLNGMTVLGMCSKSEP